jgi:hypothetical protein
MPTDIDADAQAQPDFDTDPNPNPYQDDPEQGEVTTPRPVVVVAREALTTLLQTLQANDADEIAEAWRRTQDPDLMEILADGWRDDEDALSSIFSSLTTIPGQVQRARNLRRAVSALAEERTRRHTERVLSSLDESIQQTTTLASAFGSAAPPTSAVASNVLESLRMPPGYAIDGAGTYRLVASPDGELTRRRIASAPMFLSGRTIDVMNGEAKRQVVWRGPSGWCTRIVERRTILDARQLLALTNLEAPVNSNTTGQVIAYLSDFEAENSQRLPAVRASSSMGWQPDGGFLLPDMYYRPDVNGGRGRTTGSDFALTAPPGLEKLATGWTPSGTWEGWLSAMELLTPYPYVYIALYASACAPLLEMLNLPGFVVDFSGSTSGGKTTALRVAAAVWGRPSESYPTAMYSWDATKVWIERASAFICNLPIILDETKRARSKKIIRDVIYDFCQGQGRGRGSINGTRATGSWRSVLISSGEGAATNCSQDAGTRARVLSVVGKPLGHDVKTGARVSEEVQILLAEHYGHLGRRIAQYLVANAEHHETIREVYRDTRTRYADGALTAVSRRHAAHLAAIDVAAGIIHQLGVPTCDVDPFGYLIESQTIAGLDADRPASALQDILSWCASNQRRFWGRHDHDAYGNAKAPINGWTGTWKAGDDWEYVGITVLTFHEKMDEIGHDPREIVTRWAERGWLLAGTSYNKSRTLRIDGAPTRCYCIKKHAADEVFGDTEW